MLISITMRRLRNYTALFCVSFARLLSLVCTTSESNVTNVTSNLRAFAEEKAWCPPAQQIRPCVCSGPMSFALVVCDRIVDPFTIHEVTRHFNTMKDVGKFSLTNSRVSTLKHRDLGVLQCEYIYARKNTVKIIESGFFNSSRNSLKRIEITNNDVENFPFRDLPVFPKLEYIILKYNSLKSIPDYAFGHIVNTKIQKIDLSFNKITFVGSNAFKYLCGMKLLDLRFNKLTVINNYAFAVLFGNPRLSLDLSNNKIMFISEGAFENQVFHSLNLTENNLSKFSDKIFLSMIKEMTRTRNGTISVKKNRFRCTCENVGWLVRLPAAYKTCVLNLECVDKNNRNINELNMFDIGC